ncbi:MAG: pantoate--beta-alanine ligase [Oscillospiraceae bacterium]|nr:pantoate--beta-alanine ligase [Oscillospiraceae bacterium]
MVVVKTIKEVRDTVKQWRKEGLTVGFVPTMGYLHEGHQSLIRAAGENDRVVVSIFLNPMQFGPTEDLATYPKDIERDKQKCLEAGADLIFAPEVSEMYEDNFQSYVDMNLLTEELCGLTRPCHFRGVCTVVTKLFNIVKPDKAYFGKKDAQQLAVIKRMVADLNMDIEIVGCPIIREEDGLAKSSRNTYLNADERKAALVLSKAVKKAEELTENGVRNSAEIISAMTSIVEAEPLAKIDYIKIVSLDTMQQISSTEGGALIAMAVYIGKTRLIDNFFYEGE